ncbi:hypothetical protein [Cupriavidus sp. D39]|uniref:TRAFAC clade GTPase domain-containing protein n=1 Tax=Cupriavidus sp. D39 TaxID=2997877 RepID=UPI00226E60F2|nr:hypothetical protein [Cupriavidus sp. D39]MCY0854989.1 hypothetical protein [Cupriavidus sp. D39]
MTSLLVVGMPNSGKSTFIAALRHLLIADEVPTHLRLTGLAASEAHLNKLEGKWLACETIERTKPATEGWVELQVQDRVTGAESTLRIPDLRGEAFEQPACIGQCQIDLFDALSEAEGILLFTNADREDDALLIDDIADILDLEPVDEITGDHAATLDGQSPGVTTEAEGQAVIEESTTRFRPEEMPEEVKLVEFLQLANRRPLRSRRRKVAVIVSAWDVVTSNGNATADAWLATRRPMLSQFLATNDDLWDARVYGVSAQGGRLPQDKSTLEKIGRPSERIRIVGHDADAHDISAPLRWLLPTAD